MNPLPIIDPTSVSAAPPDWDSISLDITCPLCAYNLRGLTEPRCPECGYQFAWPDVLDPKRRWHPYIFEHHPRHNVWSFLRTAIGGLRPWKFWSSLRPYQTARPRRLFGYWAASMLITTLLLFIGCMAIHVARITEYNATALRFTYSTPGGVMVFPQQSYFTWYPLRETLVRVGLPFCVAWVICLVWPWLTLAILMIFRLSMRRAKVRNEHVLRSVLYSADGFLWAALLMAVCLWVYAIATVVGFHLGRGGDDWELVCALVAASACLFPAVKLWAAYQQYLRFPHALATIIAAQVIFVLTVMAVPALFRDIVN